MPKMYKKKTTGKRKWKSAMGNRVPYYSHALNIKYRDSLTNVFFEEMSNVDRSDAVNILFLICGLMFFMFSPLNILGSILLFFILESIHAVCKAAINTYKTYKHYIKQDTLRSVYKLMEIKIP